MRICLIAPHQDDEIISSFGYLYSRNRKDEIKIIFATNGDYHGMETARARYYESVESLSLCGIPEEDIYYMGYADTGMRLSHSFLHRLYNLDEQHTLSSAHSDFTYHPAGKKTIHALLNGKEALYTKHNFIADLSGILKCLSPDRIIMPSIYDQHGDHLALSYFMKEHILSRWQKQAFCYLVHTDNDLIWPPRKCSEWTRPEIVPESCWNSRIRIPLYADVVEMKKQAILCFQSQKPASYHNFLLEFAKAEEFFLQA